MKHSHFILTACLLVTCITPSNSQIVLSEIMADAPQSESYEEFIELYNTSPTLPVNLAGWRLGDQDELDSLVDAGHGLVMPPHSFAVVLDPGYWGNSTIYDPVINQDALIIKINDGAFGANGLRNDPPDTVILITASGVVACSFCYLVSHIGGYSCEKIRLEWGDDPSNWALTLNYLGTPGWINSVQPPDLDLGITSILVNPSPLPYGSSLMIQAVLENLGMQPTPTGAVIFALSNPSSPTADTLLEMADFDPLSPADSAQVAVSLDFLPPGPHQIWAWHNVPDSRAANDTSRMLLPGGYAPGSVIINEFMAHPQVGASEWVEIFNPGQSGVDLMGFALADSSASDSTVLVNSSSILETGEFGLLAEDSTIFSLMLTPSVKVFILNNQWSALNDNGDAIRLFDGVGAPQDSVPYYGWTIPTANSLERLYPSHASTDPANWLPSLDASGSTPGRPNSFQPPVSYDPNGSLSFSPDPFDPDRHGALAITLFPPEGIASAAVIAFDLRGRRLKVIFDQSIPPGVAIETLWNGHDHNDRRLPPGLYILFVEFRDTSGNRKSVMKKTLVVAGRL